MKMLKRTLALMLALIMMFSAVPFNAYATESTDEPSVPTEAVVDAPASEPAPSEGTEETVPEETVVETTVDEETVPEETVVEEAPMMFSLAKSTQTVDASSFIKVFHLDCGRKHFTVDQIKELIDAISAKGFSHMELAIGNDGLRLLLDDMSITANGTTYNSDTIKSGIKSGNKNYSHSGEWTEAEMDTIIAYAKTKGIEIIPLVNNPGHMDSILAAMKACGIDGYYKSSSRTVDLENDAAVAFTQALVMKYAAYFANKGCNYFNIGADEYANDYHTSNSTGMGFGYLIDNNKYGNFITYVNELVADICALGVTPIAFNDGIYFRENTSFGTFDTRLVVAAWTGGWGGIKPASTTFLQNKGHQILNTNERWYYVLGRRQAVNSTYCYESALSNAKSENVTTVTDHKNGVTSMGAMQCVWCDVPSVNYEIYKTNVMTLINTLADSNPTYFTGPNEVTPAPEPEVPEDVGASDETTGISVSADGVNSLTVTPVEEAQLPAIEAAVEGKVLAWDMTPATADGNYKGEATVAVPVPEGWDGNKMGAFVVNDNATVTLIDGAVNADGLFEFTMPHFSVGGVYEIAPVAETPVEEIITVSVGSTATATIDGANYTGNVDRTELDENYAEVSVKYEETPGGSGEPEKASSLTSGGTYIIGNGRGRYLVMNGTTISSTTDYNSATEFTITGSDDSWKIQSGNYYLRHKNDSLTASTNNSNNTWSYDGTRFYYSSGRSTYRLNTNSSGTWRVSTSTNRQGAAYTVTPTDPVKTTTVTFTGVSIGTTYVTVGNVHYTINVVAEDLSKVDPVKVEWWITNIPVEATDGTVADGTNTVGDHKIPYSSITAQEAYGVDGVEVADHVPSTARWVWAEKLSLWKGTRLLNANRQTDAENDDKTGAGDDFKYIRYYDGKWSVSFDRITWLDLNSNDQLVAYYLQIQKVSPEVDILFKDWGLTPGTDDGTSGGQVALSVAVVYPDGTLSPVEDDIYPDTSIMFNYWANRDIGIVAPVNNSIYNISKITVTHGTRASGASTTWPDTASINWEKTTNEAGSKWFDERTVWTSDPDARDANDTNSPMVNGAASQDNAIWPAKNTGILVLIYLEPVHYENNLIVKWVDDNAQSSLIHEIEINVSSDNEPKNFYDELKQTSALPTEGVGGSFTLDDAAYVTNSSNVKQTFNKDITVIHDVAAQYKSGLYKYVGADLNAEGTVLTLHYNVDPTKLAPMYVVDFGLPMVFPISDLVQNPGDMSTVEFIEQPKYGTAVLANNEITYTPTTIIQAIDVLPVKVTFNNGTSATVRVGIAPATSVYYEEGFLLNNASGWETIAAKTDIPNQSTVVLGETKTNNYGYDGAYASKGTDTGYIKGGAGASTSFTFTGTGFQLYGNSNSASGYVTVYSQGSLSKLYMINTKLTDVDGKEITGTTYHGLPFISETDLPYGTYTVQIKQTNGNNNIYLDGVRILNTINDTTVGEGNIYYADKEDIPAFYEVRDFVLNALAVESLTDSDYIADANNDRDARVAAVKDLAGQVYNHTAAANASAVIVDKSEKYTTADVQKLLDNGPKNELYLYPNQTLTFNVKTPRVVQLGLKAPTGSASFDLTVNGTKQTLNSISSSVDMFYEIAAKGAATTGSTVSISVPANSGVLSVTLLKICDDPGVTFPALTQEDIENTLMGIYGLTDVDTPVEPEVPETPVEPEVPEETTKPTEPEVEETTKPSKPGKPSKPEKPGKPGKPENTKPTEPEVPEETTKPTEPQKPGKPGNNGNQKPGKPGKDEEKTYTLKVTFVNLFGKKVGTATITTTNGVVSASEIIRNAPAGRIAVWLIPVTLKANGNTSIVVPVL